MGSRFRDLVAYQRAAALADELHVHVRSWPALEQRGLGSRLLRAIDSVGANIAESAGRWHTRDRRQLLMIARGSLYEAEYWLLRAEARNLLAKGTAERIEGIARPLTGLIRIPTPQAASRGPQASS